MQTPPSVTFPGTLVAGDLASAIRRANFKSWTHRLLIIWMFFLLAALTGGALQSGTPGTWAGLMVPVAMLGWLLGGSSIQARSQFRQNRHLGEPGTYEFDSSGVRISRPSLEIKLPWSALVRIVECKDQYLLYTTPKCFLIVPRRFFPDEERWREVVAAGFGRAIERI